MRVPRRAEVSDQFRDDGINVSAGARFGPLASARQAMTESGLAKPCRAAILWVLHSRNSMSIIGGLARLLRPDCVSFDQAGARWVFAPTSPEAAALDSSNFRGDRTPAGRSPAFR